MVHGQTDRIAYGIGAHASRATVMTGNAVHVTARNLRGEGSIVSHPTCCKRRPPISISRTARCSCATARSARPYRWPTLRAASVPALRCWGPYAEA